ncbi:MAG: hypothetical protein ACQEQF_00585 [Bacillota bacterium]
MKGIIIIISINFYLYRIGMETIDILKNKYQSPQEIFVAKMKKRRKLGKKLYAIYGVPSLIISLSIVGIINQYKELKERHIFK